MGEEEPVGTRGGCLPACGMNFASNLKRSSDPFRSNRAPSGSRDNRNGSSCLKACAGSDWTGRLIDPGARDLLRLQETVCFPPSG
jgi:hypothetical protein